jgi:outer membrane biosynthesis protein TonB
LRRGWDSTNASVWHARIGADARPLDDATLSALKTWKFKPAMCGAEAIVSDIQVVVSLKPKK